MNNEHSETTAPSLKMNRLLGFVLPVVAIIAGAAVVAWSDPYDGAQRFLKYLISGTSILLFLIEVTVGGVVLYLARCRARLLYGISECLVGIILAQGALKEAKSSQITLAALISILLSLYVIVRGLDNIGKWVDKTGHLKSSWSWLFGKSFT